MQKSILLAAMVCILSLACLGTGETVSSRKVGTAGGGSKDATGAACTKCHPDMDAVLPSSHPKADGKGIVSCVPCHAKKAAGESFALRLHRAHGDPGSGADCSVCHKWVPGRSFGVPGGKASLGKPSREDMEIVRAVFASWASGAYLDAIHQKADVGCSGCHGKRLPQPDDTVENATCHTCHGTYEELARRTEPSDFKDRNPHNSHYGQITCTVCHHAHKESAVLCLDCHSNFKMTIQGGAAGR